MTNPEKTNRMFQNTTWNYIDLIYNQFSFFVTFSKSICDLTLFLSTFKFIGKESVNTYNIVHLLARINFAFLWCSKNIMLESEIIELSVTSVGFCADVSMML